MMPEEAYKGLNYGEDNHVHGELEAAMQGYLSAINRKPNRRLSTAWRKVCRAYSTPISERSPDIRIRGQDLHSPDIRTVARHQSDDYATFTSFTHHPFDKPFVLEVSRQLAPGQYMRDTSGRSQGYRRQRDRQGLPVAWAADVSDGGFKWKRDSL